MMPSRHFANWDCWRLSDGAGFVRNVCLSRFINVGNGVILRDCFVRGTTAPDISEMINEDGINVDAINFSLSFPLKWK